MSIFLYRRTLLTTILLLAAHTAAAEPMGVRPSPLEYDLMQSIPLVLEGGGRRTVERIRLDIGGTVIDIAAVQGVMQTNQNRIRLHSIPIIGQLFSDRYSRDDLTPERRLADAFFENGVLTIQVARGFSPTLITRVVVLNGDFSYEIEQPQLVAASGVNPRAVGGERLGTAFLARDRALIILVPPSIITNGLF
jgi:hypothetical protein